MNLLLVRVPAQESVNGRELRDYILESLSRGVLVLTEDATCELMKLPLLGGVMVEPTGESARSGLKPEAQAEAPQDIRDKDMGPMGRNAAEKRAIRERLKAYRESHGLGCWAEVSKASGGKLTEDMLRDMSVGTVLFPIAQWRRAALALDKLEGR